MAGLFSSLLVAVDLSPASEAAAQAAILLAKDCGAKVLLLHVAKKGSNKAAADAAEDLSDLANEARKEGIEAETQILQGDAATSILKAAAKNNCDAIVMATTGLGKSKHTWGSVAQEVIRKSKVPVLVTPGRMTAAATSPATHMILAAVDFEAGSATVVATAAKLAKQLKAGLRVLHVVDIPFSDRKHPQGTMPSRAEMQRDEEHAARELALLCSAARKAKVGAVPVVSVGHPASAIVAAGRVAQASLLVIGLRPKTKLGRFLLGSNAHDVVALADRPVLLVPAAPLDERGDSKQ